MRKKSSRSVTAVLFDVGREVRTGQFVRGLRAFRARVGCVEIGAGLLLKRERRRGIGLAGFTQTLSKSFLLPARRTSRRAHLSVGCSPAGSVSRNFCKTNPISRIS